MRISRRNRLLNWRRWRPLLVAMVTLALPFFCSLQAQAKRPSINAVKVGFLYNVAKFVTWPKSRLPEETTPLRFGVIGNSKIRKGLSRIAKTKTVDQHPIEVMQEIVPVQSHILYVEKNSDIDLRQLMMVLKKQGVLVISDHPRAFAKGVHIHLSIEDGRLHFQANQKTALRDELQLDAKLLSLADHVER